MFRYDLSIRDLRQEDSGRYECTATNAYGVTRRDVELKVIYGNHFLFIVFTDFTFFFDIFICLDTQKI